MYRLCVDNSFQAFENVFLLCLLWVFLPLVPFMREILTLTLNISLLCATNREPVPFMRGKPALFVDNRLSCTIYAWVTFLDSKMSHEHAVSREPVPFMRTTDV